MTIPHLKPQSFDQQINELVQQKAQEIAAAKEAAEVANRDRMMIASQSTAPVIEIVPSPRLTHVDLLHRAMRNLYRLDSKVVWTLLHRDVYHALLEILDCNDLGTASEACFLIHDKLPPLEWRDMAEAEGTSQYFYEIAHGEYLGPDSWSALAQSQLLHSREDMVWVGVPVVQANRYKVIRPYQVHLRVTAYILFCTDPIAT